MVSLVGGLSGVNSHSVHEAPHRHEHQETGQHKREGLANFAANHHHAIHLTYCHGHVTVIRFPSAQSHHEALQCRHRLKRCQGIQESVGKSSWP